MRPLPRTLSGVSAPGFVAGSGGTRTHFLLFGRAGRDFKGVVEIGKKNGIDWNAIRAEYLTGNISQQKLADKYGIPYPTLRDRAQRERWKESVDANREKIVKKALEKTAETAADNAVIAANIKRKALLILERLFDEYALSCTERRITVEGVTEVTRLRDLTAAYKEVTGDIQPDAGDSDILKSLLELEKRFK